MDETEGHRPDNRLRRCRKYTHGLSLPPSPRDSAPRGAAAFLPCPLPGQGECRYRRAYACTENIQEASRKVLGHCFVERVRYQTCLERGVEILRKEGWKEATSEEQAKVAAWAEAYVYQARALAYALMRLAQEVDSPSHANLGRYQTAAMYAVEARYRALLPEAPSTPGLPEVA